MKNFKKAIALMLALIMTLGLFSASASAAYSKDNIYKTTYPEIYSLKGDGKEYPTIILPGINHSKYYLADENGNAVTDKNGNKIESSLLMLNETSLYKDALSLFPNVLASLITQKDCGLSEKVSKLANNAFSYMVSDKSGNTVNNLVTYEYPYPVSQMDEGTRGWFYRMLPVEPFADVLGEENIYLYTFPLFGDPMESAAGLDSFIETVLSQPGAEKVNLASVSLGGTILTAYLDCGKNIDKVDRVVNMVSLLDGTDVIADFFERGTDGFNLQDDFLYKDYFPLILEELSGQSDVGYFINIVLRILPRSLFNNVLTAAYSSLHENVLTTCPQFWAMIPKDRYESLAEKYLNTDETAALKAKTDRFQQARVNLESNMLEAEKNGTEIYSICGYNLTYSDGEYCFFGIVNSTATANSDAIIPVYSASIGATTVKKGDTFSAEYLALHNSKYISPEKNVDASTCLFPNRTWFFANQHHEIGRNDIAIRLATCILSGKVSSVDSTPLFPQWNGTRNTRSLVRSDSGYLLIAKEAMLNVNSSYSEEQLQNLTAAYTEATAMLENTICNSEEAEETTQAVVKALADMGIAELPEVQQKNGFSLLKFASDVLYIIFKGSGYFEKLV